MRLRRRSLRCAALGVWLALATAIAVAATIPIYVVGDGAPSAIPAIVRGGIVYVPLRGVVDRTGVTYAYRKPDRVTFSRDGRRIATILVGSRSASVGGAPARLETAPFATSGEVFLPLPFVTQVLHGDMVLNRDPLRVTVTPPLPGGAPVAAAPVAVASGPSVPLIVFAVLVALAIVAALALVVAYRLWCDRRGDGFVVTSRTYDDATAP